MAIVSRNHVDLVNERPKQGEVNLEINSALMLLADTLGWRVKVSESPADSGVSCEIDETQAQGLP